MDINDVTQFATSTPEEAASNIDDAELLDINATDYKENSKEYKPEVQKFRNPSEATPPTAEFMSQSSEHAAIVKDDINVMDYMSRQMKLIGDYVIDRPSAERRLVEKSLQKMDNPDDFSPEDEIELQQLNQEMRDLNVQDYGLDGPVEKLPAQVLGVVSDTLRGLGENAEIVAAFAIAGGGTGAGAGSVLPGAGNLALGIAGSVKGFVLGTSVANFLDGYKQLTGSTYNELTYLLDENGESVNIDESSKANISRGVGLIGGVVSSAVGYKLAKATPFLEKFLSPRKVAQLVTDQTGAAIRKTLANIGTSVAAGSAGGGIIEISRIVGEEFGRYEGTEASFMNFLEGVNTRLASHTERVATGVAVGGLTAGAASTFTGLAGFKKTKSNFQKLEEEAFAQARDITPEAPLALPDPANPDRPLTVPTDLSPLPSGSPIDTSVKVLQVQDAFQNLNTAALETKMGKLSPTQMDKFKQMVFANTGLKSIWLDAEEINKIANDPENAEKVRQIVDPTGVSVGRLNAPIKVSTHEFLDLVKAFPKAKDSFKLTPEGPTPNQAREFLESAEKAQDKREEILSNLGVEGITHKQKVEIEKSLTPVKHANDVFGEEDFMSPIDFSPFIKDVVPEKELSRLNKDYLEGKQKLLDNYKDVARYEMDQVKDILIKEQEEILFNEEIAKLEGDHSLEVVDKFNDKDTFSPFVQSVPRRQGRSDQTLFYELTENHKKKGFSPFAIDPRTLTDKQAKKYLKDPQLKKHKVFVEGGINAEESAQLLGVNGAKNLFKILSQTPSRDDIANAKVKLREKEFQYLADRSVDLEQTSFIKNLRSQAANDYKLMTFMRDKKWTTTKGAIGRISLPLKTLPAMKNEARNIISKMTVEDLNPNQFKVAHRKSQRMALKDVLAGRFESAYINKEKAVMNSLLIAEAHLAIGRTNRVFKLAKRFDKPRIKQELKDAGPGFVKASDEILDHFDLSTRRKGLAEKGAYNKWVKQQVDSGNGNFTIPERLFDVKQSATQLSVEAVDLIGQRLKAVHFQAKMKNKLYRKYKQKELIQTQERIGRFVDETLKDHPDRNPKRRMKAIQKTQTAKDRVAGAVASTTTMLKNMENIVTTLDKEQLGGDMHELLFQPLADAQTIERERLKALSTHIKSIADEYNKSRPEKETTTVGRLRNKLVKNDFAEIQSKVFLVPEFEEVRSIGNSKGYVTKGDLMVMMANLGDPDGLKNLENFGLPIDTIIRVLDRELDERDAALVQNLVNVFESYKEETAALQKETTGQDVTFIEAVPYEHRGIVRKGGYFPQAYAVDFDDENAKATIDAMRDKAAAITGGKDNHFYARQYVAEMTKQGRLEERVGSNKPLDTSFERFFIGYQEAIHDLSYRKPIRDQLETLRIPEVRLSITETVGPEAFNVLQNSTMYLANRVEAQNLNFFGDQNRMMQKGWNHFKSGYYVSLLALNASSLAIQPVAITQTALRMGKTGPKHLTTVASEIMANPYLMKDFFDFASEINPSIKLAADNIDDSITRTIADLIPRRHLSPNLGLLARSHEMSVLSMMSLFTKIDSVVKVIPAIAAYRQYLAGDVDGTPLSKINKMTDEQKKLKAIAYARQVSRLTMTHSGDLDKSIVQRLPGIKETAAFYTDLRNVYNNHLAQGRKIKWKSKAISGDLNAKEAVKNFKNGNFGESFSNVKGGNFKSAGSNFAGVAGIIAGTMLANAVARFYIDTVRGEETPLSRKHDLSSPEGREVALAYFRDYMAEATPRAFVGSIPGAREAIFINDNKSYTDSRSVTLPFVKILTDLVKSPLALSDLAQLNENGLTKNQVEAILYSSSYISGGWPVNATLKLKKWFDNNEEIQELLERGEADQYIEDLQLLKEQLADDPKTPKAVLKDIEDLEKGLSFKNSQNEFPEDGFERIKTTVSNNDWSYKDPDSTAAGLYGFTEQVWESIDTLAPDLGLTENGRVSKDSTQQESAADELVTIVSKMYPENDVPVTLQSVYGAFTLGPENYMKLVKTPNDTKLKKLDIGEIHSWMKSAKTVGQLKKIIDERVR